MSTAARSEAGRVVEVTAPCRVDLAGGVLASFEEALRPPAAVSVAVALDRRAYCRVATTGSGVRVESKDTLLKLQVPSVADLPNEGVPGLVRGVLLALGARSGLDVITQARVPFETGLGSSFALAVAIAAATTRALGRALVPEALPELTRGLPGGLGAEPGAGVDTLAAIQGGALAAPIVSKHPESAARLQVDPGRIEQCLLLVDPASGPPLEKTVSRPSPDEAAVRGMLATIAAGAERVRDALVAGQTSAVSDLVAAEHEAWRSLGLDTGPADAVARLVRTSGGAARACGRGPKSLVLVWAEPGGRGPGPREAVADALKAAGYRSFPCRVDLRGLEVEEA